MLAVIEALEDMSDVEAVSGNMVETQVQHRNKLVYECAKTSSLFV